MNTLAYLYLQAHRLDLAETASKNAFVLYSESKNDAGQADTLGVQAALFIQVNRLDEAERAARQALALYNAAELRRGEANTLTVLGNLYLRQGRESEAEQVFNTALALFRQYEERIGEAYTYQGLGTLARARNQPLEAFQHYLRAYQVQVLTEDALGQGGTLGYLARTAFIAGHFERAVVLASRAFTTLRRANNCFGQMLATNDLFTSLAQQRDEGIPPTLVFLWAIAKELNYPLAQQYEPIIREMGIDPDTTDLDALREEALPLMAAVFQRYEKLLHDRGEDPCSPLEPTSSAE